MLTLVWESEKKAANPAHLLVLRPRMPLPLGRQPPRKETDRFCRAPADRSSRLSRIVPCRSSKGFSSSPAPLRLGRSRPPKSKANVSHDRLEIFNRPAASSCFHVPAAIWETLRPGAVRHPAQMWHQSRQACHPRLHPGRGLSLFTLAVPPGANSRSTVGDSRLSKEPNAVCG